MIREERANLPPLSQILVHLKTWTERQGEDEFHKRAHFVGPFKHIEYRPIKRPLTIEDYL
jgi:hypothetical protein